MGGIIRSQQWVREQKAVSSTRLMKKNKTLFSCFAKNLFKKVRKFIIQDDAWKALVGCCFLEFLPLQLERIYRLVVEIRTLGNNLQGLIEGISFF